MAASRKQMSYSSPRASAGRSSAAGGGRSYTGGGSVRPRSPTGVGGGKSPAAPVKQMERKVAYSAMRPVGPAPSFGTIRMHKRMAMGSR